MYLCKADIGSLSDLHHFLIPACEPLSTYAKNVISRSVARVLICDEKTLLFFAGSKNFFLFFHSKKYYLLNKLKRRRLLVKLNSKKCRINYDPDSHLFSICVTP